MKIGIFAACCVIALSTQAQIMDSDRSILDSNELPGWIKEKKPEVENPYARNYYLSSQWQVGNVEFSNNTSVDNVLIRYDVVKHIVEIKNKEEVFLVSAKSVEGFTWYNTSVSAFEKFESTKNFYNVPEALFGFFEVIAEKQVGLDEYKVLTHHDVYVYLATTSVSLSGSHRSNDIYWNNKYFLFQNGNISALPAKRKDLYPMFGDYAQVMKKFIKTKGLFLKDKEDVERIFSRYFELLDQSAKG